ncbi:MAG: deoxyribodipyrimidine photo-lyase [Gammaproteobacteria bacterium]|nr:deoxyribodipyrimidine photo-lyase [Gammaproteobacteria bacterium]
MNSTPMQLVWLRQDLRVFDNPALAAAAATGKVLPVYILEEPGPGGGRMLGGAARWWLHHSLCALQGSLEKLLLLRGDPLKLIPELAREVKASRVYWNRRYEPQALAQDRRLEAALTTQGVSVATCNAALLFEPWQIKTLSGQPYRVFTPFWRACQTQPVIGPSRAGPIRLAEAAPEGDDLASWKLLPSPDWASEFGRAWSPGEAGAQRRLRAFLRDGLRGYRALRDYPAASNASRLSPHIHWGEISPRQIWEEIRRCRASDPGLAADADKFLAELGWREFAHHLLFHFPDLPSANWKRSFDNFPWRNDSAQLRAWQRGRTGYPLVDAGMRELWTSGYLPNRVRLVTASFLVKHLRIDWRSGESWFWDTLVDADEANNAAGWQWVFGSGADAAPYFRIFNPVEQGRKFDPQGSYIRRWCPELARLPDRWIHAPFEAPLEVLRQAGVALGHNYPNPIVEHASAREAALAAYASLQDADAASCGAGGK